MPIGSMSKPRPSRLQTKRGKRPGAQTSFRGRTTTQRPSQVLTTREKELLSYLTKPALFQTASGKLLKVRSLMPIRKSSGWLLATPRRTPEDSESVLADLSIDGQLFRLTLEPLKAPTKSRLRAG